MYDPVVEVVGTAWVVFIGLVTVARAWLFLREIHERLPVGELPDPWTDNALP